LESLGFHGAGLEHIYDATKQSTGMILVTGPTGSGKTTTLYTILDILNQPDVNISTIEEPIEYQMARPSTKRKCVRYRLYFRKRPPLSRASRPDIIMVGEIRDTETAGLAVNAALTGHLVLSTIHTNSASANYPAFDRYGSRVIPTRIDLARYHWPAIVRQLTPDREE